MDGGHSESNRGSFFQRARSWLKYRGSFFQRVCSRWGYRGSFFQRARSWLKCRGSFFQRVCSCWGYRGSFFQRACSWLKCRGSFFQRVRSRWEYRGSFFQRALSPRGWRSRKIRVLTNATHYHRRSQAGAPDSSLRCHLLSSSISLIVSLSKPRSWAILKR